MEFGEKSCKKVKEGVISFQFWSEANNAIIYCTPL